MSDLGARADDYERRLVEAGGTDGLIKGLVKDVDRGRKIIVLLVVTLIADLALSAAMAGVALVAWTNTQSINDNTVVLSDAIHKECLTNQKLVAEVADVYEVLIEGARLSEVFTPDEKADRVRRYIAATPPAHVCTKP